MRSASFGPIQRRVSISFADAMSMSMIAGGAAAKAESVDGDGLFARLPFFFG